MKRLFACIAIFHSVFIWSNPTGHEVTHGNVLVSNPSKETCLIRTNDHAVIMNWQDFSIQPHETTSFIQPSETSVILNRVIGEHSSEIFGTLQANGQILLLNQNGILFGKNATINVTDLIASTLYLSDEDFLKGESFHFHGPSENAIVNHGTIEASFGNVTLLSRHIVNTGTITTPQGKTELVCGAEIFLKPHDKERLLIRPQDEEKSEIGLNHQGKIKALETYLQADGNLYELAIKSDGEIDALTMNVEGGRIYLSTTNGTALVTGKMTAPGGDITLVAENILVTNNAHLSTSANHKGGTLQIGKGDMYSSDFTFIGENAHLEANALENGLGGNILCWSDGTTLFLGKAEVQGGFYGGDGGFIEVSGKESTLFHGSTDRSAPFGESGKLLLDPETNFKISTAYNYNYDTLLDLKKPTADIANLTIDTLLAELEKGPVTIQTAYDGLGGLPGYILIHSDISHTYESPHTLTFESTGEEGIIWNGSLINKGTGSIELLAVKGSVIFSPAKPETPAFVQTSGDLTIGTVKELNLQGAFHEYAGLKTAQDGTLSIYAQEGVFLSSAESAPAFMHVEEGNLLIETSGPLCLHGLNHAAAEMRSIGKGNISITGASSVKLLGETGPALISLSHRYGNLHISQIKNTLDLRALQSTAAIEGGVGSVNLSEVDCDINIFAENAPATISSYGPITIKTLGDIHLDAEKNDVTIKSNNLLHLSTQKNLILTAEEGSAALLSPEGLHIHAQEDILLNGTSQGNVTFKSPSSHIFAGNNLELFSHTYISGENGPLLISTGRDLFLSNPLLHNNPSITASDLQMNIGGDLYMKDDSSISTTAGTLHLSVGKTAYLDHASHLSSHGGPIYFTSLLGNIHLAQNSEVFSASDGITLSAGKSVVIEDFATIKSHGDRGLTVVVDQLTPNTIGLGGFILGSNACLSSGNAPLEIYTGKRVNNSIKGTLNGVRVSAALLYLNTKEERWGIFYPSKNSSSSSPSLPFTAPSTFLTPSTTFTLVHKEIGLIQTGSQAVTQQDFSHRVVNFTGPFTAELFRDLHPYSEYTQDSVSFKITYPEDGAVEEEPFSIKRPTFRHVTVPEINP